MKNLILLAILSGFYINGFSQKDTTRIEQYCIAILHYKPLRGSFEVSVDYGDTLTNIQKLRDERGNNLNFGNIVQFFNYMGKQGWRMISKNFGEGTNSGYLFRRKKYNSCL